jgi:hypothetical protein
MACTSLGVLVTAARKAKLKLFSDAPTPSPNVRDAIYDSDPTTVPLRHPRVAISHLDNGAVVQLRCSGVVASMLDPVLKICTDVGPATRTDRASVRAWALAAEKQIDAKPASILRLSASHLLFVACQDSSQQAHQPGIAFQMYLFVQAGAAEFSAAQCRT